MLRLLDKHTEHTLIKHRLTGATPEQELDSWCFFEFSQPQRIIAGLKTKLQFIS